MTAATVGVELATPTTAQVLDCVLNDVLADASGWTKYAAARNANGKVTDIEADDAVKFCMYGAIRRAAMLALDAPDDIEISRRVPYWDAVDATHRLVARTVPCEPHAYMGTRVSMFNDNPNTSFEDVVLVFKQAQEKAAG